MRYFNESLQFGNNVIIFFNCFSAYVLGGMESSLDFAETSSAQPTRCTQLDKEPGITSTTDNENADG